MAWTNTSNTCVSTYGALDDLQQFGVPTTFENAGPLTMKDLQFFNALASGGLTGGSALAIATALDNVLSNSYAGTYQAGNDANKAITAMLAILQVGTNTVEALSDTVNLIYTF